MKKNAGFTLIEIMIAVVIVGILAAIAYPSYVEHIRSGRRADAKAALVDLASFMERYYTEKMSYKDASLPYAVSPKGATGSAVFYDIAFSGTPDTSFVIQATPNSTSAQADDKCGVLTINEKGAKTAKNGGSAVEGCW